MYAGIGYFTIPFIKGGAGHVHACELNPNRFPVPTPRMHITPASNSPAASPRCAGTLRTTPPPTAAPCTWAAYATSRHAQRAWCASSRSRDRYEGDNQVSARGLPCVADRVSLGLLPSADAGIPLAVHVLRERGGVLHVHGNCVDTPRGIR